MTSRSDSTVHVAMMNLLWPRDGLSVQDFWDYWVGAHTQISSRLPGIHQYFQHQLDPVAGRMFPRVGGVEQEYESDELFYGDAEITFIDADSLARFAAALNPLMQDEQNVFSKTISYQAVDANSRTFTDRTPDESPNGDLGAQQKFMLYVRKREDVELATFRHELMSTVGPALADAPQTAKVRIRLPEFYDNDAVTLLAPNVSNWEAPERQYQACIELMFDDALGRQDFGYSETWKRVDATLGGLARTVHTQRALRTFTVYNHGRITTAGLRTPAIADQIRRLGAVNQVGDEVIGLVMRQHTHWDDSR